ncbi:MAG TPA: hypothetical protein VFG59_02975 [Anaeromyxobacter sp.]|nr:hypothetical protein [Anaeromyxobacter sp.]
MLRHVVVAAVAFGALLIAGAALAEPPRDWRGHESGQRSHSVPEFDPAAGGALAALLAGGALVAARRRSK